MEEPSQAMREAAEEPAESLGRSIGDRDFLTVDQTQQDSEDGKLRQAHQPLDGDPGRDRRRRVFGGFGESDVTGQNGAGDETKFQARYGWMAGPGHA